MVKTELRNELPEESVVFDNYAYDDSIIGITVDDRVVYSYEKMVQELANESDMSIAEAAEWIDFNTIRALAYSGPNGPIIMYDLPI